VREGDTGMKEITRPPADDSHVDANGVNQQNPGEANGIARPESASAPDPRQRWIWIRHQAFWDLESDFAWNRTVDNRNCVR